MARGHGYINRLGHFCVNCGQCGHTRKVFVLSHNSRQGKGSYLKEIVFGDRPRSTFASYGAGYLDRWCITFWTSHCFTEYSAKSVWWAFAMSSQLFQPSRFSICRGFALLFLTKTCLSRKLYTGRELWTQQNADVLKKDLHLQPVVLNVVKEKVGKKESGKKVRLWHLYGC